MLSQAKALSLKRRAEDREDDEAAQSSAKRRKSMSGESTNGLEGDDVSDSGA